MNARIRIMMNFQWNLINGELTVGQRATAMCDCEILICNRIARVYLYLTASTASIYLYVWSRVGTCMGWMCRCCCWIVSHRRCTLCILCGIRNNLYLHFELGLMSGRTAQAEIQYDSIDLLMINLLLRNLMVGAQRKRSSRWLTLRCPTETTTIY